MPSATFELSEPQLLRRESEVDPQGEIAVMSWHPELTRASRLP